MTYTLLKDNKSSEFIQTYLTKHPSHCEYSVKWSEILFFQFNN